MRKETRCCHIGYSYRLTARVLLYAPSHRQDNTYDGLCYTSRGALAGTRNSSIDSHESKKNRSINIKKNKFSLTLVSSLGMPDTNSWTGPCRFLIKTIPWLEIIQFSTNFNGQVKLYEMQHVTNALITTLIFSKRYSVVLHGHSYITIFTV